jgi:hypothetical protein
MTTHLRARYDGRVLVPEQPVDLPVGHPLEVQVVAVHEPDRRAKGLLESLAELAETLPPNPDAPADGAAQHDHYLYGVPKQP